MLQALIVGMVTLTVAMNLGRMFRIMFRTTLPRAVKSDLAGWQFLDATVTSGMVVLFLTQRYSVAFIYLIASFYLTLAIPGKSQEILEKYEASQKKSED